MSDLGLVFLAAITEMSREHGREGALWPSVRSGLGLHRATEAVLFAPNGHPRHALKDAIESACLRFGLRNVIGLEGTQEWFGSVFLQVYADEVWTGIEYQVAAHLVYEGHVAEGLAVVRGVRDRYDGRRRNPWNEVECGSHYARALASWSVLLALSGFSWSAPEGRIAFAPRLNERDFRCFFSAGTGWGVFSQKLTPREGFVAGLESRHGEVRLRHVNLANTPGWPRVVLRSAIGPGGATMTGASLQRDGDTLAVDLGAEIVVGEGQSLRMTLGPGA